MANGSKLPQDEKQKIFIGAILHDVEALTPEDKTRLHNFEEVNIDTHCICGAALYESCPLLKESSTMVRGHHKPWNKWETAINSNEAFDSQVL
ncbi:MAG: hypothetical protein SVZ03_07740 [Spirochaetota bacterium]|nr:hypothetical protein [Spirochaetota bacterium]